MELMIDSTPWRRSLTTPPSEGASLVSAGAAALDTGVLATGVLASGSGVEEEMTTTGAAVVEGASSTTGASATGVGAGVVAGAAAEEAKTWSQSTFVRS
jgi:hypothetical protein